MEVLYEMFIVFDVTSDECPEGNEAHFDVEFDAKDDREAVQFADSLLDEYMGPYGVKELMADGLSNPVIEDTLRADVYQEQRRLADLVEGITHIRESKIPTKRRRGHRFLSSINSVLGERRYG
jgi:hypothetical protein